MPHTWADIGQAERLLAWRPRTSFDQGIAYLVEWYQANQARAQNLVM